ncbi:fimbrial protein [Salmonella enterica]
MSSNVKLLTLGTLIVFGFSSYAMAKDPAPPTPVTVDGGTLHFTGKIVSAACAVDNDSDGQTVRLGQFRAGMLAKKDAHSEVVPFDIKLTNCDLGGDASTAAFSTVAVTFLGVQAGSDNKAILVSGSSPDGASNTKDAAQNVGIEILQDGKPVTINGSPSDAIKKSIHNGDNTLSFGAAYIATADGATAGTANADATFQLTYE